MSLRLVEPATALAVTLAEAKAHLRVTESTDDTMITAMIHSAAAVAEQLTGRAIMEQVWELTLDNFDAVVLTRPPVISVNSITYVDTAGVTQTLAASAYRVRKSDDFGFATVEPVYGTQWPETLDDVDVVKVTFTSGYEDVPQGIKSWILLQVGAMYENRELEAMGQTYAIGFAGSLLDGYKVWA